VVVEYLIPLEEADTLGVGVAVESPLPLKEGMAVECLDPLKVEVAVAVMVVVLEEAVVEDHSLGEEEAKNEIKMWDDLFEELWAA
jgi:hypothetical protein